MQMKLPAHKQMMCENISQKYEKSMSWNLKDKQQFNG